jgi:hypothetical protein
MNEHHWPDDHHDDGADHVEQHDDAVEQQPDLDLHHDLPDDDVWEAPAHDEPLPEADHDPGYAHHAEEPAADHQAEVVAEADPQEMDTVGADPDALPDTDDQVGVFPPAVDVGPLPEPVDGYPWIDTGSLGVIDPAAVPAAAGPDPDELAEYAATDLPPGADPWAALAGSEDPATSALARFWSSPAGPDQS